MERDEREERGGIGKIGREKTRRKVASGVCGVCVCVLCVGCAHVVVMVCEHLLFSHSRPDPTKSAESICTKVSGCHPKENKSTRMDIPR